MIDYFDLCKKGYNHCYCSCYYYHWEKIKHIFPSNERKEFHQKIIKSYFNIEYIKLFYLLQKVVEVSKNICNINTVIDIFINLYDNSNVDCNTKNKNKLYNLYNNIALNKLVDDDKKVGHFITNTP